MSEKHYQFVESARTGRLVSARAARSGVFYFCRASDRGKKGAKTIPGVELDETARSPLTTSRRSAVRFFKTCVIFGRIRLFVGKNR
jgi:hypothetical protein